MRQYETLPEDGWQQIFNDLLRRLPRELYWSALLPLTYETVGDQGVRLLSEDLADIYCSLENGLRLQRTGGLLRSCCGGGGRGKPDGAIPLYEQLGSLPRSSLSLFRRSFGNL